MLTEAEKKWLGDREQVEIANGLYSCAHCKLFSNIYSVYTGYCIGEYAECPIVPDFQDAAEFEARVAAKLTGLNAAELPCYPNFLCPFSAKNLGIGCKDCFLKHARLAVEEEMET
jgi:hypothetical protein